MNRARTVLLGIATLVAAGLAVPTAALADGDPAGTIVLANGPSAVPKPVAVIAATPNAVVFEDERGLVSQPRNGTAATVLATGQFSYGSAAGSLVLYTDSSDNSRHWYDTADGDTGVAPSDWAVPAPTGGLIVTRHTPDPVTISLQNARTGAVRVLTTFADPGQDVSLGLVGGTNGVVVSYGRQDGGGAAPIRLGYVPYAGGKLKTYGLGAVPTADLQYFSCAPPSATTIACATNGSSTSDVFATPISGTAVTVVATPQYPTGIAIAGGVVGWFAPGPGGGPYVLQSVKSTGGTVTTE